MKKVFVSAFVGCLFSSTVLGAGLINGSFEEGAGFSSLGLSSLPSSWGWVIGSGEIDHLSNDYPLVGTPYGQQYIDLNGYVPGVIYQDFTFPTTGEWAIRFEMEANPDTPTLKTMDLEFGEGGTLTALGSYSLLPFGGTWVTVTTPTLIVDDLTTYRLQFRSTTGSASGVLIDNVQLTPIPEPTSLALLGLGAVALSMLRRQRQN